MSGILDAFKLDGKVAIVTGSERGLGQGMATALAHEIRNPLGSIKGAGQYLRSETDNPENQKLLDVIIEETDRLNNVVTQFMNYAKPYAVSPKLYDINGIIEKAVEVIRISGLPEGIAVETDLHPVLPLGEVHCSLDRLIFRLISGYQQNGLEINR